jgi:hypothetical protein
MLLSMGQLFAIGFVKETMFGYFNSMEFTVESINDFMNIYMVEILFITIIESLSVGFLLKCIEKIYYKNL